MAVPQFVVELGLGYNPGAASIVWTVLPHASVRRIAISGGRQYERNQMEARTATIDLLNLDRRFDPTYRGSPYYPNVLPVMPVRVRAQLGTTNYGLFVGTAERLPISRKSRQFAEVQLQASDGFELLSNAALPGATYPVEFSGTRVSRALDAIGWSATARNIAAGQSQMPALTFADADDLRALTHLLDVADSETGLIFCDGSGNARFFDRYTLIQPPYTTVQGVFASNPTVAAGELPLHDLVISYDKDLIANDWRGTRSGGATQIAIDSNSIAQFFRRTLTRTPMLTTDSEVLAQMQYELSRYKTPALRIDSITITPGTRTDMWQQVLGREIGDRLTVKDQPPGGGDPISLDVNIQHLDLQVDVGPVQNASMTWGLLPASINSFWTADYSAIDVSTRAAY
jgi:hypothetical protein